MILIYGKDNKMLLSIIIPYYNVPAKMLVECLESIKNQKRFFEIEVIIIDDGSDNFPLVDENFCFKYIRQDNQGVSVARNRGILEAEGEYIIFVDPDDRLTENAFEYIYRNISRDNEAEIFLFSNDTILNNQIILGTYTNTISKINKKDLIISVLNHQELFENFSCGSPWAKVFKRAFIIEKNLQFIPGLKKCQDRVFMLYAYYESDKIVFISSSTYCYRADNETSICNRYNDEIDGTMSEVIYESNKFIQKYYSADSSIYDAFNQMKLALTIIVLKLKFLRRKSHVNGYKQYCNLLRKYIQKNDIFANYKKNKRQISSIQRRVLLNLLNSAVYFPLYFYGVLFDRGTTNGFKD